ncbi:hypothetical protein [Paraburkholderia silvatlantica]|uniref:hypothetical protein n=1 Tax=Paraburkholderia silvatlantica TaxID=321895 RepID=UPI001414F3D9|nr:hypothetical protein [Paraburkholderia silvatlantica]
MFSSFYLAFRFIRAAAKASGEGGERANRQVPGAGRCESVAIPGQAGPTRKKFRAEKILLSMATSLSGAAINLTKKPTRYDAGSPCLSPLPAS